jgi:uncharacterized protein
VRDRVQIGPPRVFLTVEWRYLAMLNYAVDPALLKHLIPPGTELDFFEGKTYVSLVGFQFLRTKVLGYGIPFHRDFEEINLRFYVRRVAADSVRRGVVFIREIVPRYAIARVAQLAFNENYVSLPMSHRIEHGERVQAEYSWRFEERWNSIRIETEGGADYAQERTPAQFITEHYWGYSLQRGGGCLEYQVEHRPWRVWQARSAQFEGDAAALYGPQLAAALNREPDSAFLAEGSPVVVHAGRRMRGPVG